MLDLESSLLALVVNQWPHYITSWRAGMDIQICVHMDGNELCSLVSPLFDYHVSTIQSQFLVQTAFAWNKLAVMVRTSQIKREEELNKTQPRPQLTAWRRSTRRTCKPCMKTKGTLKTEADYVPTFDAVCDAWIHFLCLTGLSSYTEGVNKKRQNWKRATESEVWHSDQDFPWMSSLLYTVACLKKNSGVAVCFFIFFLVNKLFRNCRDG